MASGALLPTSTTREGEIGGAEPGRAAPAGRGGRDPGAASSGGGWMVVGCDSPGAGRLGARGGAGGAEDAPLGPAMR
jgi:hypothetical protein